MRASSSAARAISSTDASMRRSAKRLRNASSCSIGSATRRDCHDAGHDERAQRAEQRVDVRSRHAVLHKQRGGVSRHQRALWVVVALPFEHRRHDARQLVDKRRREHRVGERDDEQQLERLRLRAGALDNAPHELAALPRRGVTATRRPVETRTCEKRSSAWLSMPRCKIAAMRAHHDAPRQPSMCTSVDARSSARACALALPTAGACTESPSHSRCSASASHATRRASTRFATKRSAAAISTPRSSPSPLLKPSTQC